jgi:hypothetical protein
MVASRQQHIYIWEFIEWKNISQAIVRDNSEKIRHYFVQIFKNNSIKLEVATFSL